MTSKSRRCAAPSCRRCWAAYSQWRTGSQPLPVVAMLAALQMTPVGLSIIGPCMSSSQTALIEDGQPGTWQELQTAVARILAECGYDVAVQKHVQLARGESNIDVWADDHSSPANVIVIECKNWRTPATKAVVHAFRTVVGDSGTNTGLIVSREGFQDGDIEAAAYSNVRLLDWPQFQSVFCLRWFTRHMAPTVAELTDPLHEYTEPINSRIFRKADALPVDSQARFKTLRNRFLPLAVTTMAFNPVFLDHLLPE